MLTTSKKDLSHIAIILKEDEAQEDEVDETPTVVPRRAAAVDKNRVNFSVLKSEEKFLVSFFSKPDPSMPEESRQENQKVLLRKLNVRAEARLTSHGDKVSSEKFGSKFFPRRKN